MQTNKFNNITDLNIKKNYIIIFREKKLSKLKYFARYDISYFTLINCLIFHTKKTPLFILKKF